MPTTPTPTLPGPHRDWNGFALCEFAAEGQRFLVAAPREPAPGLPWIWRTEFFDAWPAADLRLLALGWHVVHLPDAASRFGSPRAVGIASAGYAHLVSRFGFSRRPALEGFSRGGLLAYNWAAAHPDWTPCIYADAPVCDLRSWPGGKGRGPGNAVNWLECLAEYGLTEAQMLAYRGNPIDQLAPLAAAGIPALHVVGDADEVVPVEENSAVLEQRYRALGGHIEVLHKPGVGHHPHSLEDPTPIVEFVLRNR